MSAYAERDRIAAEIAANAEREALLSADERLALARERRNRLIGAAFGQVPGATITVEVGDDVDEITVGKSK